MKNTTNKNKLNKLSKVKNLKKLTKDLLLPMQDEALKYCYTGYDIYFLHGWISAILSTAGEVDDDNILPLYLILNDKLIPNNKNTDPALDKFVDNLIAMYSQMAIAVYEENKLIKPMINIETPNVFDMSNTKNISNVELLNLYKWLYGYLSGYISVSGDIQEICDNEDVLNKLFFPALFTLCSAFLLLDQKLNNNNSNKCFSVEPDELKEFYEILREAIDDMWESDELDELNNLNKLDDELDKLSLNKPNKHKDIKLSDSVKDLSLDMVLTKITESLNAIFSVVVYTEANKPTKH